MEKKLTITFTGSYVKTTFVFSILFLIIGFFASAIVLFLGVPVVYALAGFLSSFLLFLFFMCLSKILENLYISRTLQEIKMESEGYEITLQ